MTNWNKMKDTHEKTQHKMHKACLLNSDEKYHNITDDNSTRTAVGCRPNITKIHRHIRTANRSHINQRTWARLMVYPAVAAWTPVLELHSVGPSLRRIIRRMPA